MAGHRSSHRGNPVRRAKPPGQAGSAPPGDPEAVPRGTGRRRFLGYLLAAPTLVAAAQIGEVALRPHKAEAAIPSAPEPSDIYDLNDLLTAAATPTANLITVQINKDGTASFALPRCESGQGITTSTAMLIAEELDLPLDKISITLAEARPELLFNQFTAGSNTTISTYTPIRVAAAIARQRLLEAAAIELGDTVTNLTASAGQIISSTGLSVPYGALAEKAASAVTRKVSVSLKPESQFTIIGTPQSRIDALDAVTGRKTYTMDLDVPGALPTMVCRPPTIKGTVGSVQNLEQVLQMPGITDVAVISTGVAVRGETFGQCIDAVRALKVTWGPGTVDGESDGTVAAKLKAAEIPLAVPELGLLAQTVDAEFTFYWKSNSALEPNTAIADVRPDGAEIWSSLQAPISAQEGVASQLGLPVDAVTVHVMPGGGAFGRRMFNDVVYEAAEASQQMGKPVKLMWHRADEFRQGRVHPMCISHVRASYAAGNVLAYEQRHTSVATDYTQGFGEILTEMAGKVPPAGLGNLLLYSESIFELTVNVPYEFGVTDQLLNEIFTYDTFHSGSVRNLYNADVVVAREVVVDQLAKAMGQDPYGFRRQFLKADRTKAVLDKAAQAGQWGRAMPAGTAQGIALHEEYHGVCAALAEIDCRPATVNRKIRDAYAGPRVTKVVFVVDVGLPVNPLGLQAQMMGGIMDGIAEALTSSLHLTDGHFAEASWDNYYYTREWNTPPEVDIIVMPPTTGSPGGAGEFGVAASKAAVACAYGRATGTMPTSFPINHDAPLGFTPYPTIPPVPPSPTDGLDSVY
jgi:isoquinoline 1-oxidoreductase subunit beta